MIFKSLFAMFLLIGFSMLAIGEYEDAALVLSPLLIGYYLGEEAP